MATRPELIQALDDALLGGRPTSIADSLHPDVVWGDCHSAAQVVRHIEAVFDLGASISSGEVVALDDRLVVDLVATVDDERHSASVAVFDDEGLIVEMQGPTSAEHARTVERVGPFVATGADVHFASVAPVFPVADVDAAVAHYQRLGFAVEHYGGAAGYAFANRGDVALHLAHVGDVDPKTNMSATYIYVADAAALFAEWKAAEVAGRLHAPTPTDYGLLEGAHVDPDGNLMRFGSPLST